MSQSHQAKVDNSTAHWINKNAPLVRQIPEPGEEYLAQDLPEGMNNRMQRLNQEGLINKVGSKQNSYGDYRTLWKTDPEMYEYAMDLIPDSGGLLPCCIDSSILNERGVEGITCGNCGEIHDKEDIV